mmetsp:Transcript_23093/g.48784  ORF Transcript_23093/g.48784 Transcript_23093/m.48784 type:complete len:451 (+) Transcript_23093:271-1623(+)
MGFWAVSAPGAEGGASRPELRVGRGVASVVLQKLHVLVEHLEHRDDGHSPVVVRQQQSSRSGGDAVGGGSKALRGLLEKRHEKGFRSLRKSNSIQPSGLQPLHHAMGSLEETRHPEHVRLPPGHRTPQPIKRRAALLPLPLPRRQRPMVASRLHPALHGLLPRRRTPTLPRRLRAPHRSPNPPPPQPHQRHLLLQPSIPPRLQTHHLPNLERRRKGHSTSIRSPHLRHRPPRKHPRPRRPNPTQRKKTNPRRIRPTHRRRSRRLRLSRQRHRQHAQNRRMARQRHFLHLRLRGRSSSRLGTHAPRHAFGWDGHRREVQEGVFGTRFQLRGGDEKRRWEHQHREPVQFWRADRGVWGVRSALGGETRHAHFACLGGGEGNRSQVGEGDGQSCQGSSSLFGVECHGHVVFEVDTGDEWDLLLFQLDDSGELSRYVVFVGVGVRTCDWGEVSV